VPNWVSDFRMRAHYVLNRLDGTRERIVTLRNVHGVESRVVALTSQAFAQPVRFREWLLNIISGATWNAGQQELNFLQADVAHEVAWKDVGEVAVRGYDENSKLWFFRTEPGGLAMAYLPDGTEKFASKEGVIWHEGQGYRMSETDHEGQDFCQGEPCLWPAVKATEEELRTLFQEVSQRLYDTIGGYAGYLALGAMLAFGAGPELYARYTAFPGLWLHGETNQGKSSVSKWLLRLWGFKKEEGVSLPDSTKVGVSIAVQQYGNLPVWLEEYQPKCPPWMQEKIKGIYNRESGIKKVFEEKGTRKIRTNVIITGVATSPDSQLRSRYCHVPVSERNRIKEHYQWFEDESPRFYLLGRHILRNRKEFARLTLDQMKGWIDKRGGTIKDARARIVHGASYAAFAAMAALLQSHGADLLNGFAEFLQQHCVEAVSEVKEQVNVNQFWTDLLAALTSNAFGETPADRRHMFIAIKKKGDQPPAGLTEHQREVGEKNPKYCWMGYRLYFRSDPVIDALRRYKRLMRFHLPLDRADLRSQMKSRPYWVAPKRDVHKQRFQGAKTTLSCWCVDLDLFEGGLGFNPVTDEEFQASLCRDGNIEEGEFLSMEEWEDPRAGDLYSLVDLLKSQEEKS